MHVYFKKLNGKWYCYGTIAGYDYSFDGLTIDAARIQMIDLLKRKAIDIDSVKWHEPDLKNV